MTRTKPAQERRADLLAAGQALFLARGIAATSLEDITRAAGVSKGLFYLYFRSKEDLVLALQEQFSRQFAARIRAAAEAQADWGAKLDACVQASFEGYRELHDLHEVLFHHAGPAHTHTAADHAYGPPPTHEPPATQAPAASQAPAATQAQTPARTHEPAHALAVQALGDLFAAGVAAGAFDVADPETAGVLCYASMHAFDDGFRGPGGPDDARLIRAAQQLFRRVAGRVAGVPGG
jgi:TetR/AcrR family transcriptional regulator, transcriptional repressor for nem operon